MFALPAFCPGGLRGSHGAHQDRVSGDHHRRYGDWTDGFSGGHTGYHQSPGRRSGRRWRRLCVAAFALRHQSEKVRLRGITFGDDLAAIDPTIWESTILAVFNRFVGTYGFPTGPNAAGGYPSWADTVRNTVGDTTEALYLQAKGATYETPPGLRDASLWKQVTERGNLKNRKVPSVNAVEGGSRVVKAADALRIGGKVAGRACAVLDGAVSAYDSYQSDSYHHPEMGEGEKDSMGRCDRRCQRYRRVLGSHIWSTTRRSDRCRRRPRRHSCWRRNRRRYRRASGKQNWTKSSESCQ